MIEFVTDLLGKTVECYRVSWDSNGGKPEMRLRGVVRAAYVAGDRPYLLIEGDVDNWAGMDAEPRGIRGEIVPFCMLDGGVRVVERCRHWDHPSQLEEFGARDPLPIHRIGVLNSCRKGPE